LPEYPIGILRGFRIAPEPDPPTLSSKKSESSARRVRAIPGKLTVSAPRLASGRRKLHRDDDRQSGVSADAFYITPLDSIWNLCGPLPIYATVSASCLAHHEDSPVPRRFVSFRRAHGQDGNDYNPWLTLGYPRRLEELAADVFGSPRRTFACRPRALRLTTHTVEIRSATILHRVYDFTAGILPHECPHWTVCLPLASVSHSAAPTTRAVPSPRFGTTRTPVHHRPRHCGITPVNYVT